MGAALPSPGSAPWAAGRKSGRLRPMENGPGSSACPYTASLPQALLSRAPGSLETREAAAEHTLPARASRGRSLGSSRPGSQLPPLSAQGPERKPGNTTHMGSPGVCFCPPRFSSAPNTQAHERGQWGHMPGLGQPTQSPPSMAWVLPGPLPMSGHLSGSRHQGARPLL